MSRIGQPIHFLAGGFAGLTIRTELQEIQRAELGRKAGIKDRRPLDPPPVASASFFRVHAGGAGVTTETEIESPDKIRIEGFVCNVDLFPVPTNWHERGGPSTASSSSSSSHAVNHPTTVTPASYAQKATHPDILAYVGEHPLRESSMCSGDLAGGRFVEAIRLDYGGKNRTLFPFPDLSVKTEGFFCLRYRIFDILAAAEGKGSIPVLAECFGGVFRIYGSKGFPGLKVSTELTKLIAIHGHPNVKVRQTERKRRKLSDPGPSRPAP
ncbi:hypothetical protein PUNSTDRAFT_130958 [Punctularia strigosozonata HHB-11173 SS5]|uniref:uncharacterized protein n=1 Tax=Punctularia strigosozonata (strain HHB-11173) TaxID=741275 RepID=UPI0004416CC6|nr:uncharacterized protein PUNSTDRAFT_130958 [Punctularia strigosozonata HHB-11173 SS5]EIN12710.1 hypothetical protein PUNSTDRAFT_130958 [Punctularia strigosozonata HHB-11173 SS5]